MENEYIRRLPVIHYFWLKLLAFPYDQYIFLWLHEFPDNQRLILSMGVFDASTQWLAAFSSISKCKLD